MTSESCKRHRRSGLGFTLPEVTVAMVILGMAAAGVLLPFADGASVQAEGLHRSLAAGLANDLLERIITTPFDQIVGTWHGYTEGQGQVKDASGTTFTDPIYANYSRDVSCQKVYMPQQSGAPVPANFILARVRVYYRGKQIAAVDRLISR
ncbi:MAG: prepilin-type N-terminal cleavage/methylation domain-containing protein [Sedimentisphaerales bacterium]|nr:prepilin-type N-terminal cleavage/methylation domain-containing protein [Sedimentisphaerales bacterium]